MSSIVFAISCAVPSQFLIEPLNLSYSSWDVLITANIPDIASLPNKVAAAAACWSLDNPPMDVLSIAITSSIDFIVPSALVIDIPNLFISAAWLSVGLSRFVIAVFNVVPAWLPLIPEFAIVPKAVAQSSALHPNVPQSGATYLNDSPSIDTFVFDLVEVLASISANREESFA